MRRSGCVGKITQAIWSHGPSAVVQADVVCEIVAKLGYRVRQLG